MELKVASMKPWCPLPDCVNDHEEKEISDDDDDDRNHKHRRRGKSSRSLDRNYSEQGIGIARSYKRRNKPFENRLREIESQSSEAWNGFGTKTGKRRPGLMFPPRVPLDLNIRIRSNHFYAGESAPGMGREREAGSWNQHEFGFSSVDIASHMVQKGSLTQGRFPGMNLPNASAAHHTPWNAFGLIPGITSGALDAFHSVGFQETFRAAANSSLNSGIPHQICRDFEERGFCLRGDMCPMEHGVNRIVVEDVQSLSQFNLPVSLPAPQFSVIPARLVPSSTLPNSKDLPAKSSKPDFIDDSPSLNGENSCSGAAVFSGADFYDPDQPLWNHDNSDVLSVPDAQPALESSKKNMTESLSSDRPGCVQGDGAGNDGNPIPGMSLPVWRRISAFKNKFDTKEAADSSLDSMLGDATTGPDTSADDAPAAFCQGRQITPGASDLHMTNSFAKQQCHSMRNFRKPSQKALRTLYVNGVPQESNRRESLLSHFQKFGAVVDIYIPQNSEKAFIQFSKREEAEAALRAPDAVMGNRFIKLWWANRDSILDDGSRCGCCDSFAKTAHHFSASRVKENSQPPVLEAENPKPFIPLAPKALPPPPPPPPQNKLETLEQLKVEFQKKQELLDQKRNEFRRQLEKLEKQAIGAKIVAHALPCKRLKADHEAGTTSSSLSPKLSLDNTPSLRHVESKEVSSSGHEEWVTSENLAYIGQHSELHHDGNSVASNEEWLSIPIPTEQKS